MTAVALTIAGSDSSGGAEIQADLKTFAAFAVFGTSAITAITAQNTLGVSGVANLDPAFVAAQIDAVADDFAIAAAKTGMLSRAEIIGAVANRIRVLKIPNVVVDPVMVAARDDGKRRERCCGRARWRRPNSGCNRHSLRRPQFPRISRAASGYRLCAWRGMHALRRHRSSLARGESLENAIDAAKRYVTLAL